MREAREVYFKDGHHARDREAASGFRNHVAHEARTFREAAREASILFCSMRGSVSGAVILRQFAGGSRYRHEVLSEPR